MSGSPEKSGAHKPLRWRDSLSFRLFLITIGAVLVIEALIFVPSATRFRNDWLKDQIDAGRLAALALEAAPSRMVSDDLAADLLKSAMVHSVAELSADKRERILDPQTQICCVPQIVLFDPSPDFSEVRDTLATFFAPADRYLILRAPGSAPGRILEIAVEEKALRKALDQYGLNILGLSLIISLTSGALIYLMLFLTFVRPMRRVTATVEQIGKDPGSWTRRLSPTPRRDEIGRAQNALSDMESAVSESFRQRERLAQLGEAVAKINHDLRNSLATAQLASDVLSSSQDPRVKRALPRIERALERAIGLASDTLKYGQSSAPQAEMKAVALAPIILEAGEEALSNFPGVVFETDLDPADQVEADPDHLYRICANLIRNAAEAM
ncbi:MAG: HAMP domain-containing sensor histidine kinase, partial [Pseudomonadota bacterium]